MSQSIEQPTSDPNERFNPAVDVDSLLAQHQARPTKIGPDYYDQAVDFIRHSPETNKDGTNYSILNLNYYQLHIHKQQGIPLPKYETDEELREFYIMRTQQLIEHIQETKPDIIFALDKSARPVIWMLQELWPLFAREDAKLPQIKFINIDGNHVLGRPESSSRPSPDEIAAFKPSKEQINQIHSIYSNLLPADSQNPVNAHTALILDEIRVSGATLAIAQKLLEEAYPNTEFDSISWMNAHPQAVGPRGYERRRSSQLPPWYSEHHEQGRGIANPSTNPFLSSRQTDGADPLSTALRADIKQLGRDIREGKQSVRPMGSCFNVDPESGQPDVSKPKYKLAIFNKNGQREIIQPST